MNDYMVHPIGKVRTSEEGTLIELEKEYIPALQGLEGFSHMNILWWFSCCDNEASRSVLTAGQPYKKGPAVMGTFATRSPERPNPIALTPPESSALIRTGESSRSHTWIAMTTPQSWT